MRTKLILTTAAIGVAGSLGAFGQVYSVNAVGYINVTVPASSFALIANQLNNGGNKVTEVLPGVTEGTVVFKYTPGTGFTPNGFEFGEWANPNQVLGPGEGFFIRNNGTTELKLTLVGEVPQGNLSTPLVNGLNLVSSQVPQAGKLVTDLKFPAVEGDVVFQYQGTGYRPANGFEFGEWSGGEPTIAVAEGFFVQKNGAGAWARTFSVNQ